MRATNTAMTASVDIASTSGTLAGPLMARASSTTRGQPVALAVGLVVVLLVLVVPPLFVLIQSSLLTQADPDHWSLENFAAILGSRRFLATLWYSVQFSAGSAAFALLLGWSAAWLAERTNTPLRSLAYLTAIMSLGTPFILYVSAWLLFFGKAGPINQLYRELTGHVDVLFNIYSMPGMIVVEGFLWSPFAFLLVGATLRNANPDLEEVARVSGASVWQTVKRVTLRQSLPSIMALAMLVFIRTMEAFEVPALVGMPGRLFVLTTDIYSSMAAKSPPDTGGASALSIIMLLLVLVLLYVYGRLSRNAERFVTVTGKNFRARPFDLGRFRYVATALLAMNFILLIVVPIATLIWISLLPFFQPFSIKALSLLTLDNYRNVLASAYVDLAINTLSMSFGAATVATFITLLAAWVVVRRATGGWLIERLTLIPLIFPGLILGLAVMELFLQIPLPLYGTLFVLIWAFVINYLPYSMRYTTSGLLQIHPELEEAATICGASSLTIMRLILAPLIAPALLAGWLFIFLMSSRVLSLAILLAGPRTQPVSVAMYDLWNNGQGTELAALGLMWSALMTAIAMIFYLVTRRFSGGLLGQA